MFRICAIFFCLCGIFEARAQLLSNQYSEEKIMSIDNNGNVICGPTICPLYESAMCFYTSTLSTDSKNVRFINACGSCLGFNGSVLREKCSTESTTLTNYTNRISINLLNSTVDSSKIRGRLVSMLVNELSTPYNSYLYPAQSTTPPSLDKPNVYVFQPPAQYITVNAGTSQGRSYDPPRYERPLPNDPCDPSRTDCPPTRRIRPNQLPPQADRMFRTIANIINQAKQMEADIEDLLAVWTPTNGKK